jgi:hypothetical protein
MKKQSLVIFLVAAMLIAATAGAISYRKAHQRLGVPGVNVASVPIYDPAGKIAGSETRPIDKIVLDWLPKDTTYGQRIYKSPDGMQVSMTAVLMGADRTSIHKPEYCLTGTGWTITKQEAGEISLRDGGALPVRKFSVRRVIKQPSGQEAEMRGIYVFWFVADNQITADHNQRMIWMARDLIVTGVLQRWAYISCMVVCAPGQEPATYQRLKEFISEGAARFQKLPANTPRLASREP